jgi:uncharacterized protein (DUF1778 family)
MRSGAWANEIRKRVVPAKPHSIEGRWLLAHELAHTIEPGGTGKRFGARPRQVYNLLAKLLTCTAFCRVIVDVMAEETPQATARLEARLPNDVYALLKRAAEIEGRTLTDFVVSAAHEAACRIIEATEIIRLSVEDQRQIADAILSPPEPTPALKQAFQRRRELLGGE